MILAPINLISLDEDGIAYITDTKMKVRQIVIDTTFLGLTPEMIAEEYENLSLAQIYAALSYYFDHKSKIEDEIQESKRFAEVSRMKTPNPLNRDDFELRRERSARL